ncbi:MAG: DUF1254 domain-containing protein [Candidatus Marinimicrobia bacterium]|nr:DUF1254 domain-containing protein [Candidatus Neomarinimicrobiota bacterium]MBL7009704.1 DUF1254 domain-containing protein [Candidatus Neomarinimicrobiota bacterium]MBL7029553.1 DUF1254 domain-containing protein [Candidatus Neomarinimicrobiota bacterium]
MGKWILKLFGAAISTHVLLISIGPEIVMRKLDRDIEASKTYIERCGDRWVDGIVYTNPDCMSNKQSARKPNPDFLYFLIPYNLSNGDLYVSTPVPPDDRYWSIHAHNRNTDAFYRITNTEINNDRFEFLITRDKNKTVDIPIAYASTKKGVVLNRIVMKDFSEYEKLDTFRRSTFREYR